MEDGKADLPRVDDDTLEMRMDQVERCAKAMAAGASMGAFCRSEHVAPGTVRAWAERLGVELPERGREPEGGGWVAVELPAAHAAAAPIEVELAGALVRVPAGSARSDVECVLGSLAAIR